MDEQTNWTSVQKPGLLEYANRHPVSRVIENYGDIARPLLELGIGRTFETSRHLPALLYLWR